MDKKIESLYQLFAVSAFGLNQELNEIVGDFCDKWNFPRLFYFYEYFCHQPLIKQTNEKKYNFNEIFLLSPLCQRIIENSFVMPINPKDDDYQFDYLDHKTILKNYLFFRFDSTTFAEKMYKLWENQDESTNNNKNNKEHSTNGFPSEPRSITIKNCKDFYLYLPTYNWSNYISTNALDKLDSISKKSRLLEKNTIDIIIPKFFDNKIESIIIPIASDYIFLGEIWLSIPAFSKLESDKIEYHYEELLKIIFPYIKKVYAPALTLLHNYFLENVTLIDIERNIELLFSAHDDKKINYENVFLSLSDLDENNNNSMDIIELSLVELWKWRENIKNKEILKNSYLFKNYVVSSNKMIIEMRKAFAAAKGAKKVGDCLPSVLVIGPPGSGKDKIAKIISLLSRNYRAGEKYVINLASLKPPYIAAPLLAGTKLNYKHNDHKSSFELSGILNSIRNILLQNLIEENNEKKNNKIDIYKLLKGGEDFPTLILDEFNSLDIDSQGVLLRFLENSEIVPIGAIKDPFKNIVYNDFGKKIREDKLEEICMSLTDCLVVGIMNEDPDDITREKAFEFIQGESYLGGLLSDLLYEHFQKIKRLRPDIKYRMVRNGKIKLPALKDRRADIPLLFYIFINKEVHLLKESEMLNEESVFYITLDSFRLLMSKEMNWPGNIRQLQMVAKRSFEHAYDSSDSSEELFIQSFHVKQALQDFELIENIEKFEFS